MPKGERLETFLTEALARLGPYHAANPGMLESADIANLVLFLASVEARYINGVAYDAKTLRLSLVEAGEGKIGSVLDQFFLSCYAYDHTKGRSAPMATRGDAPGPRRLGAVRPGELRAAGLRRREKAGEGRQGRPQGSRGGRGQAPPPGFIWPGSCNAVRDGRYCMAPRRRTDDCIFLTFTDGS